MRGARAQKIEIDGITFDSTAEGLMYQWCKEAKALGVIVDYSLQPEYDLTPTVKYNVKKELKTRTKYVEQTLLRASTYTADFLVSFDKSLGGVIAFANPVVIDVKGSFNKAASEFSLHQKMMWHFHQIYVNKVVIAYDKKEYSAKKCQSGFFALNGVPENLPESLYKKDGIGLYAVWSRMLDGLPSIKEVWS